MTLLLWLQKRGMRDIQLAAELGVHRSQISRIRRGIQIPSVDTARKIIALTGGKVGWADLMGGK